MGGNGILLEDLSYKRRPYKVKMMANKYVVTMTNPLACGHDGTWETDLLMECHPGISSEIPPTNGDCGSTSSNTSCVPPPREDSGSVRTGGGGGGGGVVGESSSGGGASVARRNESLSPVTDTGDGNESREQEKKGEEEEGVASSGDEQLISDDDLELSDSSNEVDGAEKGIASKRNRAQHQEIAEREKMARAGAGGEIEISSDVCFRKPETFTESRTIEPASSSASTVRKTLKGSVRSSDNFVIPEKIFLAPPQASSSSPVSTLSPAATISGRLAADFGSPDSLTSLGDSGEDDVGSDSSFDESQEHAEGSSEEDMDDDSYEVDVVFPPCSIIHKDRKTFKYSLCEECFKKYKADLERAGASISDVDSKTGRKKSKKRSRQRGQLVTREAPAGEKDAMGDSTNRQRMSKGESKSLIRPRKRRRKTDCVQLELEGSLIIESGKVRTGRKGKVKGPSWAEVLQAKDRCHKQVVGESSLDTSWPVKDLKRNSIRGSVGGCKVGESGGSLWQPPGRLKREWEGLGKPPPKYEDIRRGVPAVASAAKTKPQASTAGNAIRASKSGQKPRREGFGTVPRDTSRAEASKAVSMSQPIEKSKGRTAGSLSAAPIHRPGMKRALSSDSGGVALAGRSSTANGGTARYRREASFDLGILGSKAMTASAPRPTADAPLKPSSTAAPRPATRVPPRPAGSATPRPAATASSRPTVTAAPRSIATAVPSRPTSSGFDEVSSLVAKALMPLKSGPTVDAGTVTSGNRPAGHSRGYEKTSFPGVVRSVSNRKFFLWANDKLFDGKAYDSADACVREYTRLTNAPRGNQSGLGKNLGIGEATAPSRPGTPPDLSALSFNASGVSLTANKAPSSGPEKKPPLAKPKKMPFSLFGTKSSLDSSVQQARSLPSVTVWTAESKGEICPNIDGRIVRRSPLPILYFPSYSEGTTGAIRWSPDGPMGRPMDGLHVPCDPNMQPKRSGTKGGRKGRAPPDTRAKCAERGTSAKYLDSDEETRGGVTTTGLSLTPEVSETCAAVTIESVAQSPSHPATRTSNDGGVVVSNTGGTTEGSEVVARVDSCSKNVGTRDCSNAVEKQRLNTPERNVTNSAGQRSSGTPPVATHRCTDSGSTAGGENREGGNDDGRTGDAADGSPRAKERAEGKLRMPTETNHDRVSNSTTDNQVRINADDNGSQLRANAVNSVAVAKDSINLVQMRNDSATNVFQSNAAIPVQMRRTEADNVVTLRDKVVQSAVKMVSPADRLLQMQNNTGGNPIEMRNCTANGSASNVDNVANPPVEKRNTAEPVLIRNNGDNNTVRVRDNRIDSPEGHARSPWRQTMTKDESREEQGREILQSMLMGRPTGEEGVDEENGSCLHASEFKPSANRTSQFPESISRGNDNVMPAVAEHKDEAWEVKANETGVLEESDVEDDAEDARKAIKADIDKLLDDFKKRADQALGEKAPTQRSEAAVSVELSHDARHAPSSVAYPNQSSQVPWQSPGKISRESDTGRPFSESTVELLVPWVPPRRLGKPALRNMPAEDRSAGVDSTGEEKKSTSLCISSSSACNDVEAQDNSCPCANDTGGVQQVSWRTPSRLGSVGRGHTIFRRKSPNEVGAQIPADVLSLPLHITEVLGDGTQDVSSTAPALSASTESPQVQWKQPCHLASVAQRSHVVTPSVSLISTELLIESHSQEDAEEEIIQDASHRVGHVEGSPRETDNSTVDQFELLLQRSRLEYPAREEDEKREVNDHASETARTYRDIAPLKANEHTRKQDDANRVKKEPKDTETSKGDRARDELQCNRAVDEHVSVDMTRNEGNESVKIKGECQKGTINKDGGANEFPLSGEAMDEHGSVNAPPPKEKGHTIKHTGSKQKHCEGTTDTSSRLAGGLQTSGAVGIQESASPVPWKAANGAGKGDDVACSMKKLALERGGVTEGFSPRDAVMGAPGLKKGNNGICIGGSTVSRRRRDSSSPSSRAGSRSGSLDRSSNSSFAHRRGRDDIERPRNRERHSTNSSYRRRDVGLCSRESPERKSSRQGGGRRYERDDFGRKPRGGNKERSDRRKRDSSRRRASSSEEDRKSPHDDRCDWSGRRRWARSRSPQRDVWRR